MSACKWVVEEPLSDIKESDADSDFGKISVAATVDLAKESKKAEDGYVKRQNMVNRVKQRLENTRKKADTILHSSEIY